MIQERERTDRGGETNCGSIDSWNGDEIFGASKKAFRRRTVPEGLIDFPVGDDPTGVLRSQRPGLFYPA